MSTGHEIYDLILFFPKPSNGELLEKQNRQSENQSTKKKNLEFKKCSEAIKSKMNGTTRAFHPPWRIPKTLRKRETKRK